MLTDKLKPLILSVKWLTEKVCSGIEIFRNFQARVENSRAWKQLEDFVYYQKEGALFLLWCLWRAIRWLIWELFPARFIWEKIRPPENGKESRPPCTIGIWVFTIYLGCYGFASQRYENQLARAEFKYNTFTTQVAAKVPFNYPKLKKIADTPLPIQPEIWSFPSVVKSIIFNKKIPFLHQFELFKPSDQTYALAEERTAPEGSLESESFVYSVIQSWKYILARVDFTGANLIKADLKEANLWGADLIEADLSGADLTWADLSRANFTKAKLRGADLREAKLELSNFTEADLGKANLTEADLRNAKFGNSNPVLMLKMAKTLFRAKLDPDIRDALVAEGCADLFERDPEIK